MNQTLLHIFCPRMSHEMNKEDLVQKIVQLCEDENGLFVQLSADAVFNEELHTQLVKLLSEYVILLDNDEMINRSVARYLFDYHTVLEGAIYQLRLNQHLTAKLTEAHARFIDLTYKLLP
jgi:hypothetical protein